MGWARQYMIQLRLGETVQFRPRGRSMTGRINDGQLVTVEPVTSPELLKKDDIVLCKVKDKEYLHIIKGTERTDRSFGVNNFIEFKFLIGNNKGQLNGWIPFDHIFGKCIKVED